MGELEKVKLQEITSHRVPTTVGPEVEAQFNPTSMRLAHSNAVEGGAQGAQQTRQYMGKGSSVLTISLVFDTADEGTSGNPRSVREKVNFLEKFVLPKEGEGRQFVPKLRFQWGTFVFEGIIESLNLEFDFFAANGTPLRAKADLSLKEQDAKFEFLESGSGANRSGNSTLPGSGGSTAASPGGADTSAGNSPGSESGKTAPALGGETAAEFAARMGLDASAWRGLDVDLSADLSLEAGIEVGFSADLSMSGGLGVSLGVEAGVDLSLEASFGLSVEGTSTAGVGASFGGGADPKVAAGFALSSSGGLSAAMEGVKQVKTENAENASMAAFTPAGSELEAVLKAKPVSPTRPSRSVQERKPMTSDASGSGVEELSSGGIKTYAPSPAPPVADPRSTSFGYGVPLRPRFDPPRDRPAHVEIKMRDRAPEQAFSTDPAVPRWVRLPKSQTEGAEEKKKRTGRRCGACVCDKRYSY